MNEAVKAVRSDLPLPEIRSRLPYREQQQLPKDDSASDSPDGTVEEGKGLYVDITV